MNIESHVIELGIYKGKTFEEIKEVRDRIPFINWYIQQLNNAETVKEISAYLKSIVFIPKMIELENAIDSIQDVKMKFKTKDNFRETYLNYLCLKYVKKTINEIRESEDVFALETIIKNLLELYK